MDNSSQDVVNEKRHLREQFRRYRSGLSEDEYRRRSRAVAHLAWSLPAVQDAGLVDVYWPMTHKREIDTRPLIARMRRQGIQIALPVVDSFAAQTEETPRMRHLLWDPVSPLRPNRWGVHEPDGGGAVPPEAMDVIVVPAFGASRAGHRIGHGYGYYDEFLAQSEALKVGFVYDACLLPSLPHEAHDVPLDVIVTETEVWKTCDL